MSAQRFVIWFWEVDKEDIGLVGGKGANIGEMTKIGFPVPPGFIVTADAYFYFLRANKLKLRIRQHLARCDFNDPRSLEQTSRVIKKEMINGTLPKEIAQEIIKYYFVLGKSKPTSFFEKIKSSFSQPLVAVRSSATAEDLPQASFAGQQESFLNIKGEANVIEAVKRCWASLFEPRAIFYREEQKFSHLKIGIAVLVQRMIQSDTSGVLFTRDPVTNDKKTMVIEAIYGLGELIVQGKVTPDFYKVRKYDLKIMEKEIANQPILLKRDSQGRMREMRVKKEYQEKQKISNREIKTLANLGRKIEQHYFFPQDIEWGIEKGKVYILQTRPITTINEKLKIENEKGQRKIKKLPIFLKGDAASPGIATGLAIVIKSVKELNKIKKGNILIAPQTNPDYVPAMKKVVGIVTEKGGRTSHAAIVSRELGIPCVVGAEGATKVIKNNLVITINGSTGEIYKGGYLKSSKIKDQRLKLEEKLRKFYPSSFQTKTATKVYVNLAEPEKAAQVAKMNVDGIGLLRAEFMIAQIGYHPKKIIEDRKQKMFVDKLSSNLAIFCQAFSPRPVVYRTTDFKTSEYRNLIGGGAFEPEEENPMLGFRGAFRYLSQPEVFELEIRAIKKVRQKMGFKNLWLMLPFVRTVRELQEVKKLMASLGLIRSPSFKLWLMVEVPSNVILLEKFIKVGIDGVSIGSNDLTQLLLGVDRDNSEVSSLFDERDEAVLWALKKIIKTCHKYKITSSICGQAPSDYPDLVQKLVKWGITSVSVNSDAINWTREIIYEAERKITK